MTDEYFDNDTFTLTDEDGNETEFEVIGSRQIDGVLYYALVPVENNEDGDYVILRVEEDENGEEVLVTIDDDEEYDRVADIFEDELFSEIDYDEQDEDDE